MLEQFTIISFGESNFFEKKHNQAQFSEPVMTLLYYITGSSHRSSSSAIKNLTLQAAFVQTHWKQGDARNCCPWLQCAVAQGSRERIGWTDL